MTDTMGHISVFLTSMKVGGAQRIALNLCRGFVRTNHSVDLVLAQAEGALLDEIPSKVSVVDLNASRVLTSIFPLKRYLEHRTPDVLYSMMTEVNIAAVVACQLTRSNPRLVISEHNTPTVSAESTKDHLLLQLARLTYPLADHVITVSHGVRNDLLDIIDLPKDQITVIHNPIDVIHIRKKAREPFNHKWFGDPSINVIMSAGRHVPQKGFDTLIRAFSHLNDPSLRLVILGEGQETESLRMLGRDLGIQDRIDFPGFVDNPFKYMGAADVFVLSSWYEGFGNVLIEAMSTGCPVVSTDCKSGPSEILEEGKYGPLTPVKDPKRMSTAITSVLADPIDEDALISRSDDFSISTVIEQYEEVLFL